MVLYVFQTLSPAVYCTFFDADRIPEKLKPITRLLTRSVNKRSVGLTMTVL